MSGTSELADATSSGARYGLPQRSAELNLFCDRRDARPAGSGRLATAPPGGPLEGPSAHDRCLPWNGPVGAPSLEVVNVAGDSAVGRARIQSAPNLRRVHAESG